MNDKFFKQIEELSEKMEFIDNIAEVTAKDLKATRAEKLMRKLKDATAKNHTTIKTANNRELREEAFGEQSKLLRPFSPRASK